MRARVHLAHCDYCGRKIAWSRKRRQWLALAPTLSLKDSSVRVSPLARRMRCPDSPSVGLHDPRTSLRARFPFWPLGVRA